MRILIAHNRYQQRGGEDTVVEVEAANLRQAGHDVKVWLVDNDGISGLASKMNAALQATKSPAMQRLFDTVALPFKPDIVHFHNIFPRITPSVVEHALHMGLPTLLTLHNFRFICAGAMLMRDGAICEQCVGKSRIPAVLHGCYRGSRLGSAITARMGLAFKAVCNRNPGLRLIALTQFARSRFIADDFPADQILIKPNTVEDLGVGDPVRDRKVVFVGRCSPEKGVDFLMRIAPRLLDQDIGIDVIGDGPALGEIRRNGVPENVRLLGHMPREEVIARIKRAAAVVMPSRWYEGFPMVLLETYSTGTPVIASRLGSLAELVHPEKTGWTVDVDDEEGWIRAIQQACNNRDNTSMLGRNARQLYESQYDRIRNVVLIEEIYQSMLRLRNDQRSRNRI
ncbi:glycosyltransferase family 4 protein [Sphingomonas sp. IC081]|uniref:glycosyltransferase family 4 protein n=1 Tax=Sphingomonas sp. IC081 TaxID=304378 RepID=UPI00163D38A7|nr:glycosyltransferase [Sphingomonas sp. IC081]